MKINEVPVRDSSIAAYLRCPRQYLLKTRTREDGIPMTGFSAKRYWLSLAMLKLFPEERRVGPNLADIESLRGEELAKYLKFHSPEAFASAVSGNWARYIMGHNARLHGRDIVWFYHNQWADAMVQIQNVCRNFYSSLMEEGPPVLNFTASGATPEIELVFGHAGRKLVTKLGFVRRDLVIGEYGTSDKTKKEVDEDWRITLRMLAYCTMAHEQEAYRIKWGIEQDIADRWSGNGVFIDPQIVYRYHSLYNDHVIETRRDDSDINAMLQSIDEASVGIESRDFRAKPGRDTCATCRFSVSDYAGLSLCADKHPDIMPVSMYELKRARKSERMKKRLEAASSTSE